MENREIAALLREFAELLELSGEDRFRVAAYRRASDTVRHEARPLASFGGAAHLQSLPGIGPTIAAEIAALLATGSFARLDELRAAFPRVVMDLMRVPGLGAKTAAALHARLGLPDLPAYAAAIEGGALRSMKGFGAKREAEILSGLMARIATAGRYLLGTGIAAAAHLARDFAARLPGVPLTPIGSLRRWSPVIGDVGLLAATDDPDRALATFAALPDVRRVLTRDPDRVRVRLIDGIEATCITCPTQVAGGALLWLTGDKGTGDEAQGSARPALPSGFREALAAHAAARGFVLDGAGLRRGETFVEGDEAAAFAALGLPFIPPELREGADALAVIRRAGLPRLIEPGDVRGDLHTHTTWSDGVGTVAEMAAAAQARGYAYYGVSDHSQTLRIANGLDARRLREQAAAIAAHHDAIRLLHGCEIEVRADGALDLDEATLASLDYAIASVHSGQRGAPETVTARAIAAIENPYVDILAHPTGRILLHRAPMDLDMDAVIAAAARTGTALEINGDYHRLDLDAPIARRAAAAGVVIAVNSDAHSPDGLAAMEFGVMMARRAWLAPAQVLNCWPVEEVLAWRGSRGAGTSGVGDSGSQ